MRAWCSSEITPWAIFVNTAPSADLALLQPAHDRQFSDYSRILEACLFVFGVAAYGVYRIGVRIGRPPRRSITAMAWAVAVLVLVLLRAMPYRIIFQNEMERVDLGPVRCYEIGHDGAELLLLCPDEMPPRNVKVANDDPRLRRRGTVESVFTPRAESRALK